MLLFAILTALLVTWCVIAEKEINRYNVGKKPFGTVERFMKLYKKNYKKNTANNYFWNIIPSIISILIFLLIIPRIYIDKKINLLIQTLLYYNLYLLTLSIVSIILDILVPTIAVLVMKKTDLSDKVYLKELYEGIEEDKTLEILKEKYKDLPEFLELPTHLQEDIVRNIIKNFKKDDCSANDKKQNDTK